MASLVIAEHDNTTLKDSTAKTVGAAVQLGAPVHVLVAGQNCGGVAEAAAKIAGVEKVLVADDALYAKMVAEPMEALILSLAPQYDAILAPATTSGKNYMRQSWTCHRSLKSSLSSRPIHSAVPSMPATRSRPCRRLREKK